MATWLATCLLLALIGSLARHARNQFTMMRMPIAAGLLAALWLPHWLQTGSGRDWVIVCDVSASVSAVYAGSQSDCLDFYRQQVERLAERMERHDRLAVVFFANGAEIAVPFATRHNLPQRWPRPTIDRLASRLDHGLRLAANLLADSGSGKVWIYSDGQIAPHLLATCADEWRRASWAIDVRSSFPPHFLPVADVSVESVNLPLAAGQYSQITGEVVCYTSLPGDFRVRVYCHDTICHEQTVRLYCPGTFRIGFGLTVGSAPSERIEATVESLSFTDAFPANNRFTTRLHINSAPRLLWLGRTSLPDWASHFPCQLVSAAEAERAMAELDSFQALVVDAGDASQLSPYGEKILAYVRQGGGLLVCGGVATLGPGGYGGTLLEQALPVWCIPRQQGEMALWIVLDVSGSMAEKIAGDPKLELAKQAIWQLWRQLPDEAWVALSVFRDSPRIEIPFAPMKHLANSGKLLDNITAYGSTLLAPALQQTLDSMVQTTTKRRHVILLSDGLVPDPPDRLSKLARAIGDNDIALAIISTGGDTSGLLRRLAQEAGGGTRRPTSLVLENACNDNGNNGRGRLWRKGQPWYKVYPVRSGKTPHSIFTVLRSTVG